MISPNNQKNKAARGDGQLETETPKNNGEIIWKQRTQKIRECEIKRKGQIMQMEKGEIRKRRLAKIEKMKDRERMRIGNEGKRKSESETGKEG